jgi:hypothetical protein
LGIRRLSELARMRIASSIVERRRRAHLVEVEGVRAVTQHAGYSTTMHLSPPYSTSSVQLSSLILIHTRR